MSGLKEHGDHAGSLSGGAWALTARRQLCASNPGSGSTSSKQAGAVGRCCCCVLRSHSFLLLSKISVLVLILPQICDLPGRCQAKGACRKMHAPKRGRPARCGWRRAAASAGYRLDGRPHAAQPPLLCIFAIQAPAACREHTGGRHDCQRPHRCV